MPYNTITAMGDNQYGQITPAEREEIRQRERGENMRMIQGAGRQEAQPKPRRSAEDFSLATLLKGFAQAGAARPQQAPQGNGGLIVGPGRGQSDVQRMEQRTAGLNAASGEEVARARLMELRQGIRENRPGMNEPVAMPGFLSADGERSAPEVAVPESVTRRQGMYRDMVTPVSQMPTAATPQAAEEKTLIDRLREAAAMAKAESGDFASAAGIAEGGALPGAEVDPMQAAESAAAFIQRVGTQAEMQDIIRLAKDAQGSTTPQAVTPQLKARVDALIARGVAEGAAEGDLRAIVRSQLEQSLPAASILSNPLSTIPRWLGYDPSSRGAVRSDLLQ